MARVGGGVRALVINIASLPERTIGPRRTYSGPVPSRTITDSWPRITIGAAIPAVSLRIRHNSASVAQKTQLGVLMRWPWQTPKTEAEAPNLTLEERISALERGFDQLRIDWDEVLSRLTRRVAREAALKRKDLVKALDSPDAESVLNGQPEALPAIPTKAQLWRAAKRGA